MHLSTIKIPIDFGLINFQLKFNRQSYISYLHALTIVTQKIIWRRAYVTQLSPLLWKNWCHSRLKKKQPCYNVRYNICQKSNEDHRDVFFTPRLNLYAAVCLWLEVGKDYGSFPNGISNVLAGKIVKIINCKSHTPHYRRMSTCFIYSLTFVVGWAAKSLAVDCNILHYTSFTLASCWSKTIFAEQTVLFKAP